MLAVAGQGLSLLRHQAVTLNPYSQVTSRPIAIRCRRTRRKQLVLKAYPFRVTILYLDAVLARHPRCYGRDQDILDPLHYLPLLEQRPGAFEHAKPLRRWRETVAAGLRTAAGHAAGGDGRGRACASSSGCSSCTRSTRPQESSRP